MYAATNAAGAACCPASNGCASPAKCQTVRSSRSERMSGGVNEKAGGHTAHRSVAAAGLRRSSRWRGSRGVGELVPDRGLHAALQHEAFLAVLEAMAALLGSLDA